MKPIKRVGVLELCNGCTASPSQQVINLLERKQYVGVMPQAVAVWCRQLGTEVFYATFYGNGDPMDRLPRDLDLVFISTTSATAPLAYALSKAYRLEGARTVCGGPHAKGYPHDALRYFDLAVLECDRDLVADIVADRFPPQSIVSSAQPCADVPTLEERLPEIKAATFWRGRPLGFVFVPLLASMGCPYRCNFCVDWNSPYRPLSTDRLRADLRFAADKLPGMILFFCDPNFGIRWDETMAIMESISPERRNPFAMETSLTNVRQPGRLERLHAARCLGIGPGIESWTTDYAKAGARSPSAWDKMARLAEQLELIQAQVPYIQANLILGLDTDRGDEPFELTKEFLWRTPYMFPTLNVPVAFGGTPLHSSLMQEGRVLRAMPFTFYWMPYLTVILKNYDALAYYRHMVDLYAMSVSGDFLRRRLTARTPRWVKFVNTYRTFVHRVLLRAFQQVAHELETDREVRLFHAGLSRVLPPLYAREYQRQLGRYAELMPVEASAPVFETGETPAPPRPCPPVAESLPGQAELALTGS
jgi:hypothetical protein